MNEKTIIKKIIEEQGITVTKLANRLGITQQACWDRLNGKSRGLTVEIMVDMLSALDYKLVVMPLSTKVPNGGITVEKRCEE